MNGAIDLKQFGMEKNPLAEKMKIMLNISNKKWIYFHNLLCHSTKAGNTKFYLKLFEKLLDDRFKTILWNIFLIDENKD